ncbi:MAG TPA: hypothetical protein PLN20_02880 [Thermotogota bacterium]|jgi:hypothetical protein|nr:hypothetical protein [Thermotogota bacterium]NLH19892.1 hypothetical protein [Thermotogaceae bacterium]OQC32555.1 MAG: hypothetical protein BWX67_00244 [Thermotogota bacterium ADurb.Bin062]HNW46970.1 hypothetical protein [Thermotogota bacterium]HNY82127.1 hypothetical protein [Thermotogota bacterium]
MAILEDNFYLGVRAVASLKNNAERLVQRNKVTGEEAWAFSTLTRPEHVTKEEFTMPFEMRVKIEETKGLGPNPLWK